MEADTEDTEKSLWRVDLPKKVRKSYDKLPAAIQEEFVFLLRELRRFGPVQGSWPNYSKLGPNRHHCHLHPKWVACWEVLDKRVRVMEVYYVGSRKDAPY